MSVLQNRKNHKVKLLLKVFGLLSFAVTPVSLITFNNSQQTLINNSISNAFEIKLAKDTDIALNEKIKVEFKNGVDDGDQINFEQNQNLIFYTFDGSKYQEATSMIYDSFDLAEFYVAMVNDPKTTITIKVTNAKTAEIATAIINYKTVSTISLDKHTITDKADTKNNSIKAIINDGANPNSQILWSCSDPDAVSFIYPSESRKYTLTNENVQLLLRKKGSYTITACCNSIFDSCWLTIDYSDAESITIQDFEQNKYSFECGSASEINYDLKPIVFPEGSDQSIDWEIKMQDSSITKPEWLNVVNNKVSWTDQAQKGNYKFSVIAHASSNPKNIYTESSVITLNFTDAQVRSLDLITDGNNSAKVGGEIKLIAKLNNGASNIIKWKVNDNEAASLSTLESLSNDTVILKIKKDFNQPILVTVECETFSKSINVYVQHDQTTVWAIMGCCIVLGIIFIVGLTFYLIRKSRK